jgi:hypothetical protein
VTWFQQQQEARSLQAVPNTTTEDGLARPWHESADLPVWAGVEVEQVLADFAHLHRHQHGMLIYALRPVYACQTLWARLP